MTGSSIFEYIHKGDHAEVAEQLGLSLENGSQNQNSEIASPSSIDEPSSGTNNPDGKKLLTSMNIFTLD